MKTRIFAIIALTALLITLIPVNALGAGCSVTNFDYNPKTMKDTGGEVTLSFTINNNSGKVVDRYYIYLFGGLYANRDCNIADNTFLNVTPKITLAGADLGVWIPLTVDVLYTNGTSETIYTKNIKVEPIPDVIYSTKKAIIPDNSVYHIGETVQIVDNFLNRSTEIVTGVTVQYYKKGNNTIVYEDERVDLGTIYDGDAVDYTYVYTFVPEDVGKIEIASIIRYTYQGGKYEEYCVSHYFTIDDEVVTPTPAPAATPTPQPTAEPTATLSPSDSIDLRVTTTSNNVNRGDEVTFSIDLKNNGSFDIGSVEIFDNDNLITTFNDIAAGDARRYMYTVTVNKTTAFNFSAKSIINGKKINVFADIVTINVNDSGSSSSLGNSSGSSVSNSDNNSNNSNSTGNAGGSAVTSQNNGSTDTLLIAAIAVGALIFIALVIVGAILIVRSSGNK